MERFGAGAGQVEAVLRFDHAQRDTVADAPAALPVLADTTSRVACKLNRRRSPFRMLTMP